jgi:hypothetical protein
MLKKIYRYKDRPVRESDKRSEDDLNPNPKNMSSSKCKKKNIVTKIGQLETRINEVKNMT